MLDNIRRICKERGISSISELERVSGLKANTVSRWDKSMPSADKLKKAADALGVPMEELLREEAR